MKDIKNLILFFCSSLILFSCGSEEEKQTSRKLPIYGERDNDEKGDTIYHTVGNFSFKNQEGDYYSHNDLKDKIYVACFFFTSCPSICPKMTTNMKKFANAFKNNDEVRIVSFTVDPERDTVEKLKKYADKNGINSKQWNLLTGDKESIYELGVYGYLLSAQEDALAPGGFLHSGQFILVDKEKRIRGIYEGTKAKEMDRMIEDAKILLAD
jgi:protein SCO1/2